MTPQPDDSVDVPADLDRLCRSVFSDRFENAKLYAGLLANEGIKQGLLGPREADRIWQRHIINSLSVLPLVPPTCVVADIGSGAGLPGIPLALARPDCRIELVESMSRRVVFLRLCVDLLGLCDQVTVVHDRVEDYHGTPAIVVCRAVAPVKDLVKLVSHLVPPAQLLAIKGQRAPKEVEAAKKTLHTHGLQATVIRPEIFGEVVGSVVRIGA